MLDLFIKTSDFEYNKHFKGFFIVEIMITYNTNFLRQDKFEQRIPFATKGKPKSFICLFRHINKTKNDRHI
jgi:hypothetical protein